MESVSSNREKTWRGSERPFSPDDFRLPRHAIQSSLAASRERLLVIIDLDRSPSDLRASISERNTFVTESELTFFPFTFSASANRIARSHCFRPASPTPPTAGFRKYQAAICSLYVTDCAERATALSWYTLRDA